MVRPRKSTGRRATRKQDEPDASASPVEEKVVVEPEAEPEPKAEPRRRRLVRPVVEEPVVEEPVEPARRAQSHHKEPVSGKTEVRERRSKLTPFVDMIGVLPDAEVARLAGVTRSAVQLHRNRRGIPPAPSAAAAPPEAPVAAERPGEPVPAEPPAALARVEPAPLVFTEAPVPVQKADSAEVPTPGEAPTPAETAFEPEAPEAAPVVAKKRGRPSKIDQYADQLGVVPDEEIARLAGVALVTVKAWRTKKGLLTETPESRPARPPRIATERKPRRSKLDAFADRIGVLPDAEVAALAGVTPASVALWRRRHDVPAARRRKSLEPVVEPEAIQAAEPVVEPEAIQAAEPVEKVPIEPVFTGSKAFFVVASDDSEFVVLADDFASAAAMAVRRLARWKPEAQVVGLEYAADFLPE
ncbi:MAG: hypothetical protein JXB39_04040 [Deltaproteobacteria bacterium]|nr:hypothetical protein [Deltaproteobacteria bacterium]